MHSLSSSASSSERHSRVSRLANGLLFVYELTYRIKHNQITLQEERLSFKDPFFLINRAINLLSNWGVRGILFFYSTCWLDKETRNLLFSNDVFPEDKRMSMPFLIRQLSNCNKKDAEEWINNTQYVFEKKDR